MKNIYTIIAFSLVINNLLSYSVSQCLLDPLTVLVDKNEALGLPSNSINVLTKNIKTVSSLSYNNNPFKLIHLKVAQKYTALINKESLPQDLVNEINRINDRLKKKDEQIKSESEAVLLKEDSPESQKFKTLSSNVDQLKKDLVSDFENKGLDILAENIITDMKLHIGISAINKGIKDQKMIKAIQEHYMDFLLSGNSEKFWVEHTAGTGSYSSGIPLERLSSELKEWHNKNCSKIK